MYFNIWLCNEYLVMLKNIGFMILSLFPLLYPLHVMLLSVFGGMETSFFGTLKVKRRVECLVGEQLNEKATIWLK